MTTTYKIALVALMIPSTSEFDDYMDRLSDLRDDEPQNLTQWAPLLTDIVRGGDIVAEEGLTARQANKLWETLTGDDEGPATEEGTTITYTTEQLLGFFEACHTLVHGTTGQPMFLSEVDEGELMLRYVDDADGHDFHQAVYSGSLLANGSVVLWGEVDGPNAAPSTTVRFLAATSPENL